MEPDGRHARAVPIEHAVAQSGNGGIQKNILGLAVGFLQCHHGQKPVKLAGVRQIAMKETLVAAHVSDETGIKTGGARQGDEKQIDIFAGSIPPLPNLLGALVFLDPWRFNPCDVRPLSWLKLRRC